MPLSDKDSKEYEALGIDAPEVVDHGVTFDDVRARLEPANPRNWQLFGNELHCDTDHGHLVQTISPDHILLGTGEDGLPILKKLAL